MAKKKKPSITTISDHIRNMQARMSKVSEVTLFAENPSLKDVTDWVPSGFPWLDLVVSGGRGFPVGRVVQICGRFAVGKSAMCEMLVRAFQDEDMAATWLDFETSLSPKHLRDYDIDEARFLYSTPRTIEEGFKIIQTALEEDEEPANMLFVWDSVTAAQPEIEEGLDGKKRIGSHASAYSLGMRGMNVSLSNAHSTLIFINQLRQNIETHGFAAEKWKRSGGVALDFYCHVILQVTKVKTLTKGTDHRKRRTGAILKIEAKKTKFAPEGSACEIILSYKRGLDRLASLLHMLKKEGKIKAAGRKGVRIEGIDDTFKETKWRSFYRDNKESVDAIVSETVEGMKDRLYEAD